MSSSYGAAPMWPPMPTTPPTAGRGSWWRRHKWGLGLGVFVVVAGLVAGVLVWRGSRSSEPDRAAFEEALAELAAQPGVEYRTTVGTGAVDMQVTHAGDVLGTLTVAGQKVSTMTVGGRTYVKMPNWLAGSGVKDPTGLAGTWVTGGPTPGAAAPAASASTSQVQTPAAFADKLYAGLNDPHTTFSSASTGTGTGTVDGTPASKATTPDGELYVTRSAPHHLLRFVPTSAARPSGIPSLPTPPPMPSLPSDLPSPPSGLPTLPSDLGMASYRGHAAPARYAGAPPGALDFSRLSPDAVQTFYSRLESATKELRSAVDGDISFSLAGGKADLKCGSAGCSVTARVTSKTLSSDPRAKITGGKVTATLTASVTIEGRPAGGCTAKERLPLTGSSSIACDDAAAGAVFAEVEAEKKAEAEAESEAEGGEPVPYTVSSTGQAIVHAMAEVDVDALLIMEQLEQQILDDLQEPPRAAPTAPAPSAPGTRPPAETPTSAPSGRSSPPPPPGDGKDRRKPTCLDDPPLAFHGAPYAPRIDDYGADGWIYYDSIGYRKRATGAVACLANGALGGTGSNRDSPGMAEAKARAKRMFPHSKERYLVNSCHLVPNELSGRGITANLTPCWTMPVNNSLMKAISNCVKPLMRNGVVRMAVRPNYPKETDMIPASVGYRVTAWDRDGNVVPQRCSRVIPNVKDGKNLNSSR